MSEFLAEARILVRPDTTKFRAELEAALSVATKPITIPVVPVVAGGVATAAAATQAFTAAQKTAAIQTAITAAAITGESEALVTNAAASSAAASAAQGLAAAQEKQAAAAAQAAAANAAAARTQAGFARGAAASGLSLFGLRGATLAASGAFLAGTAAVVGFAKAIQSAANLETELNVFRVNAGATADEMERVSAAARALGRDITLPGVTASTAATAMTELSKAGLSVQDSLNGARGALQLATAAQIDIADATNLVAGALNSFGLAGTDAVKVADLLAGSAKSSQGEISDMATALGQASAVSNQFGVSIEDTITLLTELAQAGIEGGRAGTSLRVAFLRLVNPPAEAAKALKELNVQIRDASGNLRPEIFTDIAKALQGYTKAQRDAKLATIFGADAIRTAGIIGNKGADAFERTRDAVTEAGLAQELAGARTQGFNGDVENLANQVEALGLTVGEVAKGPVGLLVRTLGAATGAINDTTAAASDTGVFEEFGKAIGDFANSFTRLGSAFNRGVIASTQASTSFTIFDGIAANLKTTVDELTKSLEESAAVLRTQVPKDAGLGVKQLQNVVVGFDAKGVRAQIRGSDADLLAALREEQDFLQKQLQRDFVKNRPALQRSLEQSLLGTIQDIERIQKQAKADSEKVKRDAEQAASDRERALLLGFSSDRDAVQNAIAAAAQTTTLKDDIAAQKKLAALVKEQIASVRQRISVEGGRKEAILALQAILIQVQGSLKGLAEQQQQAQKEQREALLQGTRLDIDFDQTIGNKQKEIADRKKLIAQLKVELATVKKGTNAYKEIRNAIAEQNAAIDAITAEKQKQGQSFASATFEFLQTQQGFASNLLGNLIPTGATGGLVGGGAPVQSALTPAAGFADGQSKSGPTAGQAQTTNAILLGILSQLKQLNGDNTAPEAQRQNRGQRAVMDGVGGG